MQQNSNDIINFEITQERINKLIDTVIEGIQEDWPTIYKIRYIYLEIGKRLYKDVDFFFSADGKLGEANLSIPEIKEIYNNNIGRSVGKYLRVMCKSASYILKLAYDRIGIKSELVETNTTITAVSDGEEFPINHWLLVIYDNDKAYFATLTPDLPYIQMNMDTRHFASDIPYKRNYNGKITQIYKGNEIKHSVISREELKEIDMAIGYIDRSYNYNDKGQLDKSWFLQYDNAALYMLRDSLKDNKLFYELEIQKTGFYQSLMNFKGANNKQISFLNDDLRLLTKEDWNCWIKILCHHVLARIEDILGYDLNVLPNLESKHWNYEMWLLNLCVQIQYKLCLSLNHGIKEKFSDVYIDVKNFKYNKWSKQLKERFGKINNKDFNYNNMLMILDKMNTLVNYVKSDKRSGNFSELFSTLSYHFIKPEHLYENNLYENGYLSNHYIANKFDLVFRKVFCCNELITDFNAMGYSEKVTIIKDVLVMMFPEITKSNSYMLKGYDDNYSALLNRIHLYPVKNKTDGFYSIVFHILSNSERPFYFFYNTKTNTFKRDNALSMYQDYIIVSNRMKNRMSIEDLEKIDEPIKRGIKK